ncbi:hypothetical protein F2Q69_00053942 [Brassica cretica]|uniref:Uncharacterized protein n=1 Tax=Brassica cretica TaxID=69181 RepID=A0A8S9MQ85_BRACR|nr:hypothetical protein F2Q69_00053942 [Brassica cretica]
MCQNKSGWREGGVDLLVFSLSRFFSSTKPLSLLILFFSSVAPPFSDLSISVAPPSPISLSVAVVGDLSLLAVLSLSIPLVE